MKVYVAARFSRKDNASALAGTLESEGFEVVSTWTREEIAPNAQMGDVDDEMLLEYAVRDMEEVSACDALVIMSDGPLEKHPRGGKHVEYGIALAMGKKIIVFGDAPENIFQLLPSVYKARTLTELTSLLFRLSYDAPRDKETMVVDPITGGQKGVKVARFDLIPPEPLWQLASIYGYGATKYADDNWMKGYSWRLSIGAMLRHIYKFVGGTYLDSESGYPHLAHAIWHCITLMEFYRLKRGTDDRFYTKYTDTIGG